MEDFENEFIYNEDTNENIIGWCSYCKCSILYGERYLVVNDCMYHAEETEDHYDCAKIFFGEDE